jgi:uncharacterized protein
MANGILFGSPRRLPLSSQLNSGHSIMIEIFKQPSLIVVVGFVVGNLIGLTGLGGGAVVVPLLVLLYGLDQKTAQGTSLSIILSPLQLPAILNYARQNLIDWHFLLYMCPGILLGSFTGSYVAAARWFPQETLKILFALLLVYIGGYSLFSMGGQVKRGLIFALALTAIVAGLMFAVRVYDAKTRPQTALVEEPYLDFVI